MRPDVPKERQRIIEREACVELPLRDASAGVHRPDELQWPNEMRRESEQSPSLAARLKNEMEKPVLEVAESAVNQPRRAARRPAREVALFDERHAQPAQRRVAGATTAGNASADHEDIELPLP